ncbi:MAG TPA: hopanoid-associated sugar epimerase [Candidatus Tectomicrobia bacterium]|nr:hopanoid-associated sugar epimerase [Candidatus Tectomicrobia bacterium]
MRTLVTGGTGFVGANVVRLLLQHGAKVRALVRPQSDTRNLDRLDVELVAGDLRDRASLAPALKGCDTLYHVAAMYALWTPKRRDVYDTNVTGTVNLLEAAWTAGVQKIVYTSSVATIGLPKDGTPGNEEVPLQPEDMVSDYKRSKFLAEQEVLKYAQRGLPVVIVNPSFPVGPWDVKPTPSGQIIVNFLRGKIPAYVDTGLNVVDVEDVAIGHLRAAEKGRIGERYILGHANLPLPELFQLLERVSGVKAPRIRIPYGVAYCSACVSEVVARTITHKAPFVTLAGVRLSRKRMFFDASKAVRELGLPQTSAVEALSKAVQWFRRHGYAK